MSRWDDKQKPGEKSKDHGKKDSKHNEREHGLGGKKDETPKGKPFREFLTVAGASAEITGLVTAPEDEVPAAAFPSYWYQPNKPPITDQGSSPRCVAHSNGSDQNHMDRTESGRFWNFDEVKFFEQIGGGPDGAYLSAGLDRRRDFGYPTLDGDRGQHKISAYYRVDQTVAGVKTALRALPKNGGVIFLLPWYHSWFHTFASGKLPMPDYLVGYHAIYCDGWNDNYGFRLPNSWGRDWGLNGRCFLPYAHLDKAVVIYRTKDR